MDEFPSYQNGITLPISEQFTPQTVQYQLLKMMKTPNHPLPTNMVVSLGSISPVACLVLDKIALFLHHVGVFALTGLLNVVLFWQASY